MTDKDRSLETLNWSSVFRFYGAGGRAAESKAVGLTFSSLLPAASFLRTSDVGHSTVFLHGLLTVWLHVQFTLGEIRCTSCM